MPTAVEQILWTAVPNGIASGQLQVSVHVAPELSGGPTGTLSDFPHFQNWPQTVMGGGFRVQLTFSNGGATTTRVVAATIDTSVLNQSLWTALFSPASSIKCMPRDAAEPYTKLPVVSFPSGSVAAWLQSTYTQLTVDSPTALPSLQALEGAYGEHGYVGRDGLAELGNLWGQLSAERLNPPPTAVATQPPYANDFTGATAQRALAALRFYHMAAGPGLAHKVPAVNLPVVDFHRALSFIGGHRTLQRALGLVLDVTVPLTTVQRSFSAFASSSVSSDIYVSALLVDANGATVAGSTPVRPRTHCNASKTVFEAFPATSQIVGRQLTLGDAKSFAVYEVDVDGGGLKTAQFADNLKLAREPQSASPAAANGPAPDAPQSYAPPALRSVGLTVSAVNRGLALVARLNRSADLLAGVPNSVPDLTAEDLVRGFVLDVWDAAGSTWNSTAVRDIVYSAASVTLNATDEASTDAPPRVQSDPTNPSQNQLNLPENLIRWNGWSNAAPRPGLPLRDDGTAAAASDPGPFSQLSIGATPHPGSLPRLRYGASYALRARVVDIAGNVIANDAGAAQVGDPAARVTSPSVYGRHEPVGSPDIYSWAASRPGESLARLVIRDIDATTPSVRALAPSRVAEAFAELHGVFDTGTGGAMDGSNTTYQLIVGREGARYPSGPITTTSPVPYLPDPLARGGVLLVLDGPLAGQTVAFDFSPASGQSWPAYQPFGLKLTAGATQSAAADAPSRTVTFTLTRGDAVIVKLSSTVGAGDLQTLGMYQWVGASFGGLGKIPYAIQASTLAGQLWSITPATALELVFAVQRPLLTPEFPNIGALKNLGWTYAAVSGDLHYSPKSTARTDLLASWGEPVDGGPGAALPKGPGAPDTALAPVVGTVFQIPSSQQQLEQATDRFQGRHEFFDTKHREVTYAGLALSRFTEHYKGSTAPGGLVVPAPGVATKLELPGFPGLGLEPGSVTVTSLDGTKIYQDGTGFTIDPTAGTITFAAPPAGPAKGSTVQVDFLPGVSVATKVPRTLNILSSARPLAPDVAFIVPIYEWLKVHSTASKVRSGRSPSALRIFMRRPWWSSGIGELLGVVTWPAAEPHHGKGSSASTIPSPTELYVSDWGADPVFTSAALPSPHPRLSSFTHRVRTATGLTIDENPGVLVNVAAHTVQYDAARDLWYADVIINAQRAYTPMIRLALARYQPDSVPGAELSRIVLADVMSLEPGRLVTVQRKNPHLLSYVQLAGYSYGHDADSDGTGPGIAELVVERRVGSIHDPDVGWAPVGPPVPMQPATANNGLTIWEAREIKIPSGGQHRLFVSQYEVLPQAPRRGGSRADAAGRGLRIVYSDLIPI